MTLRNFGKKFVLGVTIGIAAVTPGLSGGVIAAAAGIYEPAVRAITGLRANFRAGVKLLLPLGLGGLLGVFLFSNVMRMLVASAPYAVVYAFIGLIAGSAPALVREANAQGFRPRYLWAAGLALALVCATGFLLADASGASHAPDGLYGVIGGATLAVGTVIPGISSSFLLMNMGLYEGLLSAIADIQLMPLAIVAVSFVIVALGLVKLSDILFKRFHGMAYYAVLGFLAGSIVLAFPGLRSGWLLALDAALALAGFAASFLLMRLTARKPMAEFWQ